MFMMLTPTRFYKNKSKMAQTVSALMSNWRLATLPSAAWTRELADFRLRVPLARYDYFPNIRELIAFAL